MRLSALLLPPLLAGCAAPRGGAGPPRSADARCGQPEPQGHVAQYTWHPAADPPLRCEGQAGTTGDLDDWNLSIRVHDWRHADAAVAIVAERLDAWDLGGEFGVSVSGTSCVVPL